MKPVSGKYFFNYFQYQEVVGCICMLNYCFSSYDGYCPDNYNYSRFKLTVQCRSEKWELYLYGDMTIIVDRGRVDVLPRGVPALVLHPTWQRITPSMSCACLLSVAWV